MFLSILHRMILWELIKVFGLSLFGLTGILLMGGIVAEATQQGLGPLQILTAIPLLIPSMLPYTIPTTTLFAVCLVYGRLSADNEILALKAAGVNPFRVIWPAVFLGLVVSAGTMGLYYRIIPYTHHLMRNLFLKDLQEVLYTMLKKDRSISHPRLDFAVWVRQVQGKKLIDATFKRRDKSGRFDVVIRGREAELEVDTVNRKLVVHMHDGEIWHEDGFSGRFVRHDETVDLPAIIGGSGVHFRPVRPRDMTWVQLHEREAEVLLAIGELDREITETVALVAQPQAPPDKPKHLANLREKAVTHRQELSHIHTEYQMRPAQSLGCLCFVLIGCPVAIWFSRSDYLSAFMVCFLPIVIVYYPLMLAGTNLAKEGKFMPALAVWAADAVVALVGMGLYVRLMRS